MGLQHIRRLSPDALEACELRTGLVLHPVAEVEGKSGNPVDSRKDDDGFVPAGDAEAAREALKFNSYALMLVCSLDPRGVLIMASFDSKVVDVPLMERILAQLGRTVQQLCAETGGSVGDFGVLTEEGREEACRLSAVGPRSIGSSERGVLGESCKGAQATWIVDPGDLESLLPVGAVGELLIEGPAGSTLSPIDHPQWLLGGSTNSPMWKTRLYKTGQLARYDGSGTIHLISRTERKSEPYTKSGALRGSTI